MTDDAQLNLLSPQKRAKLKHLVHFIFVKELLELVILTATILAITNLLGWLVLSNFLTNLAENTTLLNRGYSQYNQEIVHLNGLIRKLRTASSKFVPLTPMLLEFAQIIPPEIRLTDLQINCNKRTVIISGIAETRDSLLRFQRVLKNLPWLTAVTIPTSNLFQRENLSFQITGSIIDPAVNAGAAANPGKP